MFSDMTPEPLHYKLPDIVTSLATMLAYMTTGARGAPPT